MNGNGDCTFGSAESRCKWKVVNGDSLCSLSLNPSPERIDERVLRESPLEKSILLLPETAIVLE
jgi:hypothetical protein